MDATLLFWTITIHLLFLADVCTGNSTPMLISSKFWHVFEDDPVGTIVTRLRARDLEGDPVIFKLESQRPGQDLHTYFTLDKHWRVFVAKPLSGLAGSRSKDYILRVRMNDNIASVIAEVRLQVSKEVVAGGEGGTGGRGQGIEGRRNGGGGELGEAEEVSAEGRRLGGRRMTGDLRTGSQTSDVPVGNYGILRTVAHGDTFGFLPSLWASHPPLLQVNKTWIVRDDAAVGTLVDTIRVLEVSGRSYNLTLHGARGLLEVDPVSGEVTVASPLINQVSDITIMVTASSDHGDSSEIVVFKVLPSAKSHLPGNEVDNELELPDPVEVEGQLMVSSGSHDKAEYDEASSKPAQQQRFTAYTLASLIVMPVLGVLCVSSMIAVALCYCQRIQMKRTLVKLEGRPHRYVPK